MSSTAGKSTIPTSKNSHQFSLRSILVLTTLIAIAIANPGFAIFMPFVVGMLYLTALLTILVGSVQFVLADDRKVVLAYTFKNLKWMFLVAVFAIAYFAYAFWMVGNGLWPN